MLLIFLFINCVNACLFLLGGRKYKTFKKVYGIYIVKNDKIILKHYDPSVPATNSIDLGKNNVNVEFYFDKRENTDQKPSSITYSDNNTSSKNYLLNHLCVYSEDNKIGYNCIHNDNDYHTGLCDVMCNKHYNLALKWYNDEVQ